MGAADRQPDAGLSEWLGLTSTSKAAPHTGLPGLDQLLRDEPYRFEFFAAMHLLTRIRLLRPDVDLDGQAELIPIRFRAHQSLSFPASEIHDLRVLPNAKRPIEMMVTFFGLTGPMGALPRHYTELVMERMRKRDHVLRDFLDVFNHRLISLFADAGRKYRFWFAYEQAVHIGRIRKTQGSQKFRGFVLEDRPRMDPLSQNLLDLGGLGTSLQRYKDIVRGALANRVDIADETFRHYAGLLSQSHRSGLGLEQLLSGFFDTPVKVQQFVGQWLELPAEYRTSLPVREAIQPPGSDKTAASPKSPPKTAIPRLGQNSVIGSRIWEVQGKFRISLGPLTYKRFLDYLPVGNAFRKLAQLTRIYVRGGFDFDVQPTLLGPEVPWCRLGGNETPGARLGWNTWIRNEPFRKPVDDAVFQVDNKVSFGS
ncbi:type VI secretion system baseplate subunit TssG [Anatilimnocola sp. NA78]|uniref:type VI secretion system baseplate subunit TssG n=1 Tax=Anatilimnocola sp. NA78 TaxID=3415683 RepID=UPI003CE45AF4